MPLSDELLQQLRSDLQRDLDDTRSTLEGLPPDESEPLLEMLQASVEELRAALERLDLGSYGRCEACGAEIGELRLRSLPASRQCLRCEGAASTALPT